MARDRKEGLDYFSFDCDFFSDRKIKRLRAKFGTDGVMVYLYIICEIYRDKGYYVEYDEDLVLDIAYELGISENRTREIMSYLFSGLLQCIEISKSCTLATRVTVISSASVQRRYQKAVKTRAAKNPVSVNAEVWLLKKEETETFIKVNPFLNNSEKNALFSEKNSLNSEKKTQSKVKESKVNKSKGKESSNRASKDAGEPLPSQNNNVDNVDIVDNWNSLSDLGITPIKRITEGTKRYCLVIALIEQYGVDTILEAIEQIRNSSFLQGTNDRDWIIAFDWFIIPDNFIKVLEGNYKDSTKHKHTSNRFCNYPQRDYSKAEMEEMEQKLLAKSRRGDMDGS